MPKGTDCRERKRPIKYKNKNALAVRMPPARAATYVVLAAYSVLCTVYALVTVEPFLAMSGFMSVLLFVLFAIQAHKGIEMHLWIPVAMVISLSLNTILYGVSWMNIPGSYILTGTSYAVLSFALLSSLITFFGTRVDIVLFCTFFVFFGGAIASGSGIVLYYMMYDEIMAGSVSNVFLVRSFITVFIVTLITTFLMIIPYMKKKGIKLVTAKTLRRVV